MIEDLFKVRFSLGSCTLGRCMTWGNAWPEGNKDYYSSYLKGFKELKR